VSDNPLMMAFAAPAIGLAQQEGGRRVFEREGTVLADEAAGLSAINAAGFFVPGMVNREFGARVEEGRRQQPLAAFAGDVAGGFGPGEIIGAGVSKAVQAIGPGMAALGRMLSRGPGPDTSNAIVGGTLGGIAPAETAEERARNVAVGAGLGYVARPASRMAADLTTPGAAGAMPDAMPAGGYFGRQSMRPPGSGPSPREIELRQQWSTATPIVTQARTTAQSAQQAADAALQSKAPADIARAKDQKKALVGQLQEAQASRAGMDTPEDARLAETLASLTENTSDPVLLSTQISAAKTSLDRLLTDIGSPVEGNLIPVKTNILTRTQAPRSAAEGPQDRASVTRYAEGGDEVKPQGFGAGGPKVNPEAVRSAKSEGFDTSRILYRGMRDPLGPDGLYATTTPGYETQGLGVSLSTSAKAAAEYGGNVYPVVVKGKFFSEKEYVKRINKLYETQGIGSRDAAAQVRAELAAEGYAGLKADGGKLLDKGELRVWGDDSGLIPNAKVVNDTAPSAPPPISPMGFGASTPKTPQQAARFETPGSPEYEAAVAKGLDMSQAGRMARAKEMGFDTDTVLYHGTDATFDEFRPNDLGMIWLTSDAAHASNFGKVSPYYVSFPKGKYITTGQMDLNDPESVIKAFKEGGFSDETAEDAVDVFKRGGINSENLLADLIKNGMPQKNTWRIKGWEGEGEVVVTTDPANIRSVNAAFDPEKSTSSTLLAAAPFAAVGGAGLTSERELGSKMKRDKKD
jgi:hypothetical protein